MAPRDHTVRLKPTTYEVLEAEAGRREIAPDELANELVRESLAETTAGGGGAERMRAALAALEAVRTQVGGPVDAVALVRHGREELERRSLLWPSS